MVARMTPASPLDAGRRPRISQAAKGTMTTERPVMKPALEAVVYCKPAVWNP